MSRPIRRFRPTLAALEPIISLDGSGLPDVFPDPLFPPPSYDPPVSSVTPPGYSDFGGVVMKPIDAGLSGTFNLFKWAIVGIATDIANGRLPGDPPPVK